MRLLRGVVLVMVVLGRSPSHLPVTWEPAYRLTWFFSEARERDRVQQDVYPWAASGPVVYTLQGDTDWHRLVRAGWANAGGGLADALPGSACH
jgi:hypothetical protein